MHISDVLVKVKPTLTVILLVAFFAGPFYASSMAQTPLTSSCPNSTVADAWGPEFASEAKTFFLSLQRIVKEDDKSGFAASVQYPLHVYGANTFEIVTRAQMIRKYASIITPDARRAILDQSPDCLFGNGQGVMAARGTVWFQKQPGGKMKIITLNINSPK